MKRLVYFSIALFVLLLALSFAIPANIHIKRALFQQTDQHNTGAANASANSIASGMLNTSLSTTSSSTTTMETASSTAMPTTSTSITTSTESTTIIPQQNRSAGNTMQITINATILNYIMSQLSALNTTLVANQSNTTELNATHALNASQVNAINYSISELIAGISNQTGIPNGVIPNATGTSNTMPGTANGSRSNKNLSTKSPTSKQSLRLLNSAEFSETAGNGPEPQAPPGKISPDLNAADIPVIYTNTLNISYGRIRQGQSAAAANKTLEYISVKNGSVSGNVVIRPSITILRYKIQKSSRYLHLRVLGQDFSQAGNYTILAPVRSGSYTISPQFISSPIKGNPFDYTYSISFSNGTTIGANSLTNAQSVSSAFNNIKVNAQQTVTIRFDSVSLNGNYLSIDPTLTIKPSPNPLVSNSVIDVGQYTVINGIITGGLKGYTSNWFWIAPNVMTTLSTGNTVPITTANTYPGNNIVLTITAVSSNQLTLTTSTNVISNSILSLTAYNAIGLWTFNALIIDSNGIGTNTLITNAVTITINPALSITLFVSNTLADSGQWETLNTVISGGTSPFTVNFYNMTGSKTVWSMGYNQSVTLPKNIIYYIPIKFTNQNSVAVAYNTPLAVGINNGIAYSGANYIGFNALAYAQYYTCNLNNAEFFFQNGTIVPSWLEGNILNEQVANTACTSASSINALVDSMNVIYWVNPTSVMATSETSFLSANSGTPSTNIIYLGWTGNTLSTANTLFSSITGEAPQLSCNFAGNTITGCATGQYGKYDNGGNVFSLYDNFSGTTIKTAIWHETTTSTTYRVNNVLIMTYGSTNCNMDGINSITTFAPNNDMDVYGRLPGGGGVVDFGFISNSVDYDPGDCGGSYPPAWIGGYYATYHWYFGGNNIATSSPMNNWPLMDSGLLGMYTVQDLPSSIQQHITIHIPGFGEDFPDYNHQHYWICFWILQYARFIYSAVGKGQDSPS